MKVTRINHLSWAPEQLTAGGGFVMEEFLAKHVGKAEISLSLMTASQKKWPKVGKYHPFLPFFSCLWQVLLPLALTDVSKRSV